VVLWFVASGVVPNVALSYHDKPTNWMTLIPGYQTVDLNFQNYDNDQDYYVYVYAHSRRDLIKLVDDVNRVAQRSAKPGETGITIVSNEYWPLPWYFRDYQRVGYYGTMSASSEPIIIARDDERSQMQAAFGGRYRLVDSGLNDRGTFALRPGVDLLLYIRNDIPAP
jgi:predicted membrane-bound mannosyltransferase